jgi:hypothetical protein
MNKRDILMTLVLAAALSCCGKHQPRHFVVLPDVSGSIERESLEQAFKAIGELVGHLHRGDQIAIIPILGDAQAEASGRIMRFEVPKERKAYDADLRDFQKKLGASLAEMRTNAAAHPGSKTDILGSLQLAEQEFQLDPRGSKRIVIVLSDFIQEDGQVDFRADKRLANKTEAQRFAMQFTSSWSLDFMGAHIFLGSLRSKEYAGLGQKRLQAIQRFWMTLFDISGAKSDFAIDGPGLLKKIF